MIDWRHWHNEPWLIGGLVILGWVWAIIAGPLRARFVRDAPFPRGHAIRFYLSLLIFYVAVGSPLDQIGERFLFSAHMLQHQLLIYPAAILFLLGLPSWMVDSVLGRRGIAAPFGAITHPAACAIIYTLVLGIWHVPSFYDLALRNKFVHVAEHLMFFGAALFYWWPLLSPSRAIPRRSHGVQMLYFLSVVIAMTPLFAYLTFSDDILYPTYEYAPRIFPNFNASQDQLLAGVSMKLVGLVMSLGAFGVAFQRWYREQK